MTCRLSVSSYYQLLFIITITNYQYFRHNVTKRHKTEQSRHETSNYTLISLVPFIIITINIVFSLLVIYSYQIKKKTQRGSLQPKQTKVILCLVIDLLTCTSKCFIANMCNCTNYCLLLLLLFNLLPTIINKIHKRVTTATWIRIIYIHVIVYLYLMSMQV